MSAVPDDSIDRSVATFCVLLNRPHWLEPDSLKRMLPVWRRLAERHGDFDEPDVMEATEMCLMRDTVQPGPAKVVAIAAAIAAKRRKFSTELVEQFRSDPTMVMYDAVNEHARTGDDRTLNAAVDAAISAVERDHVCQSDNEFLQLASTLRDIRRR